MGGHRGSSNNNIWKLQLDGTGKDLTRLIFYPVVSMDGRFLAFLSARTTDPAGAGYGILIYCFRKYGARYFAILMNLTSKGSVTTEDTEKQRKHPAIRGRPGML